MLGFLPAMPEDGTPGYKRKAWQMLLVLPGYIDPKRDAFVLMDAVLVFVGILDNWVLVFFGNVCGGFFFATAARVFRLFRVVRLVRLLRFRFLRGLYYIVAAFGPAMRVLVWACFLLQIFVFIFSVVIVDTLRFKKDSRNDPELMEYWGDIHTAYLSLLQIATFADWTIPVASLVQYRSLYFLIIFYMGFVGIGIMNLILALMVQFAYSIANQDTAS